MIKEDLKQTKHKIEDEPLLRVRDELLELIPLAKQVGDEQGLNNLISAVEYMINDEDANE